MQPKPLHFSAKAGRTADSPINALIAAKLANPDLVNFAAGLVDEGTLPVEEVASITRRLFADPRRDEAPVFLAAMEGNGFEDAVEEVTVEQGSRKVKVLLHHLRR